MNNEQLIKAAETYALILFACLFGLVVFASRAESDSANLAQQNTNGNANQNGNANTTTRNTNNGNAASEQTGMAMSSRDQKFVMDAAMGGMMEVELGRWASQKGTSAEVKAFGQRMVTDHTAANTELMQLASSKGMTLPNQMDEKHQKNVSKITRLSGAEFDRAYSKMMLKDHQGDVKNFEKQSTKATTRT